MVEINSKEICPMCGMINIVDGDNIKEGYFCEDDSRKVYNVVYYICKCGKHNILQVDDARLIEDRKELKELTVRAYKKNKEGGEIPKKWIKKKDRLTGRILRRRAELLKELNGKTLRTLGGKLELIVDKKIEDVV